MSAQPNEPKLSVAGTMEQLSEEEKALIDDVPDATIQFLLTYIQRNGVPEYFKFTLHGLEGELKKEHRYDGYERVLAALDYIDYLIDNGIRSPFE